LRKEERVEGENTLCNIRRIRYMKNKKPMVVVVVLLIFITIGILYGTGMLQSVSSVCDKELIEGISCSTVSDCEAYYINIDVPQSWINQQKFSCENGACFIIPSECDATWIKV